MSLIFMLLPSNVYSQISNWKIFVNRTHRTVNNSCRVALPVPTKIIFHHCPSPSSDYLCRLRIRLNKNFKSICFLLIHRHPFVKSAVVCFKALLLQYKMHIGIYKSDNRIYLTYFGVILHCTIYFNLRIIILLICSFVLPIVRFNAAPTSPQAPFQDLHILLIWYIPHGTMVAIHVTFVFIFWISLRIASEGYSNIHQTLEFTVHCFSAMGYPRMVRYHPKSMDSIVFASHFGIDCEMHALQRPHRFWLALLSTIVYNIEKCSFINIS